LPARAPRVAEIGHHAVDRTPDALERVGRQIAVLGDRLAGAARLHAAVEDPPEECVRATERVSELDSVHAPPAPAALVTAETLLETVERGRERLERDLVPRSALGPRGRCEPARVTLVPELEQPRLKAPRRRDHFEQAHGRLAEVALDELLVGHRRASDILRERDGEGVIDRARDRVRVEPPVPALQALDCPYLPLSRRMEPRQPVNCLD